MFNEQRDAAVDFDTDEYDQRPGLTTYATAAEAALARSADTAEGLGAVILTDARLQQRMKTKVRDTVLAHYQAGVSDARAELEGRELAVYYVENLRSLSRHEVELSLTEDGHTAAVCDCQWYLEHRADEPKTTCVHILRAEEMSRLRAGRAMPEPLPAVPRKRKAKKAVAAEGDAPPGAAAGDDGPGVTPPPPAEPRGELRAALQLIAGAVGSVPRRVAVNRWELVTREPEGVVRFTFMGELAVLQLARRITAHNDWVANAHFFDKWGKSEKFKL